MYNRRGELIRNPERWLETASNKETNAPAVFNRLGEAIADPFKYWESVKSSRPNYPEGVAEMADFDPDSLDDTSAAAATRSMAGSSKRSAASANASFSNLDALSEDIGESMIYTEGVNAMAEYNGYQELPNQKPGVRAFLYDDGTGYTIRVAYWPRPIKMAASMTHELMPRIDVPRQRVPIYWLDRFFREPQAFLTPIQ